MDFQFVSKAETIDYLTEKSDNNFYIIFEIFFFKI